MREFRQYESEAAKKLNRPQVWRIERDGNAVTVTWGQLNGAMQETTQTFKGVNIGKANEKSPDEVAQEWMDRQILLRTRKGWEEHGGKNGKTKAKPTSSPATLVEGELPSNLRFWKPQNSLNKTMEAVIGEGRALWTRKRDGMQHTLMRTMDGGWVMYSSTMAPFHKDEPGIPWLDRYPKLAAALQKLDVPWGTILTGELVQSGKQDDGGFEVDSLLYVASIVKSKKEEALKKQKEGGPLAFCAYDIIYWGGQPWFKTMTNSQRLGALHDRFTKADSPLLQHVEVFTANFVKFAGGTSDLGGAVDTKSVKDMLELAKEERWEGYVVVDPDGKHDDKSVSLAGKPHRPIFACKVKPKLEADFVVFWDPDDKLGKGTQGTWGKGKKSKGVGAVFAYLYDEQEGEFRYITKVGGGLSDADVVKFANPKLYPMVWQIEFASWTENGSIQFPEFVRVRDDKEPHECTTTQMPEDLGKETE